MAAATTLETQLRTLLTETKTELSRSWYGAGNVGKIQTAKESTKTLAAQIDGDTRERLEEIVKKIERKLEFSERIIKFLTEKPATLDPRVEKIMDRIKKQPLPNHIQELANWQFRLTKWQVNFEVIAAGTPNQPTAQMVQKTMPILKGLSLICEMKKEKEVVYPEVELVKDNGISSTLKCECPIEFEIVNEASAIEPVTKEKTGSFLLSFQRIIESLARKSDEPFFQALESTVQCMEFNSADREEKAFIEKICAHLYSIQNKETPDKIYRNDPFWEARAFLVDGLAMPDQKLRAGQRLQVETLLQLIHLAIEREDNQQISQLLVALEQIQLNANDLPPGRKNAAHYLFERLYYTYVNARREDRSSLQNPDDQKFNGEFGRKAFRGDVEIPIWMKRKAYEEVFEAFQKTWK